jgi:hypothetical protein
VEFRSLDGSDEFASSINIHVTGRKVTEHHGRIGLASNVTPIGDFAFQSGDTKSP